MAIRYSVEKHAVCLPSNVLARDYGEHIFNVKIDTDTDNGNLVAIGNWIGLDQFAEAAVTEFEGEIVQKMSNGNWLVLVKKPGDATLVYQKPLIEEESPRKLTAESNFFNEAGSTIRTYGLKKFDRFEVSKEAFDGEPTVGAAIASVVDKKMVIS